MISHHVRRFALFLLFVCAFGVSAQQSSRIAWLDSLADARASAEARPLLVFITAGIWCDPCDWVETNVMGDPIIAEIITQRFTPVRLNDLDTDALVVDRLPTVVVIDRTGSERMRLAGPITARTLERELRLVADRITVTAPPPIDQGDQRDVFARARFRIGSSGTLLNTGGGRWISEDAGIPPRLDEFDRDDQFLYLMDSSSGTVLAISIPDGGQTLWRWDRIAETWMQQSVLTRLPDSDR